MAGVLTRDTIISNGLELGGNPALTTLAQTFLNLVLDHLYRSFDWDFLRKIGTVQADASDFGKLPVANMPADYRAILKLRPRGVQATTWLRQVELDELWLRRQIDSEAAVAAPPAPDCFAVDAGTAAGGGVPTIYVYPAPSAQLTYDILYQRLPVPLSGDTAPDFPHHMSLVYAVADWAKDYERDTVEIQAKIAADQLVSRYRANSMDRNRSNAMVVRLDDEYFPRFNIGRD